MATGGLTKRALVFKALCVLEEAIEQARAGRVAASPGLRLALAFLYFVGDRRQECFDREPYDQFWKLATQEDASFSDGHCSAGHGRMTQLCANRNGIGRAAGMPVDVELLAALRRARRADSA